MKAAVQLRLIAFLPKPQRSVHEAMPHWLTQKFAMAMAALKIEGATLHSLRHTHASQLIATGMDVLTVSRRLGHGSPGITLKTYGHLFGNTDGRAAEITEAAFARARTE